MYLFLCKYKRKSEKRTDFFSKNTFFSINYWGYPFPWKLNNIESTLVEILFKNNKHKIDYFGKKLNNYYSAGTEPGN